MPIPYDYTEETTNVGKRFKKFKTKTEADAAKFGRGLMKEAGGAARRTIKKAASYLNPKKAATAAQPPTKKKAVQSPARGIPESKTPVVSPASAIPGGQEPEKPNAIKTRLTSGGPTAPLTRPQTVSETRGLQDRTTGGEGLGPISVEAPSFVKSVGGMKNPLYDPETLRPGMRRTETGYFTDAPPTHLNITPFDTAEERAAKQKGLESWFGEVSEFHSEQGVGRQSGLRERALAHVKGKYGLTEKGMETSGRIREQEIATGGVVEASKVPGIRGGRRFATTGRYEEGDKVGEDIYDTYTGQRVEGGVGAAEMPDFVAQFRAGTIKSIDELGRQARDLPRTEKLKILKQLSESQQSAVWNVWNEGS